MLDNDQARLTGSTKLLEPCALCRPAQDRYLHARKRYGLDVSRAFQCGERALRRITSRSDFRRRRFTVWNRRGNGTRVWWRRRSRQRCRVDDTDRAPRRAWPGTAIRRERRGGGGMRV